MAARRDPARVLQQTPSGSLHVSAPLPQSAGYENFGRLDISHSTAYGLHVWRENKIEGTAMLVKDGGKAM